MTLGDRTAHRRESGVEMGWRWAQLGAGQGLWDMVALVAGGWGLVAGGWGQLGAPLGEGRAGRRGSWFRKLAHAHSAQRTAHRTASSCP